jgi:hypothetical protein
MFEESSKVRSEDPEVLALVSSFDSRVDSRLCVDRDNNSDKPCVRDDPI